MNVNALAASTRHTKAAYTTGRIHMVGKGTKRKEEEDIIHPGPSPD